MFNTPRRELRPEPGNGVKVTPYVDEPIDSLVRRFKKTLLESERCCRRR